MSKLRILLVLFFILRAGLSFSETKNVILRLTKDDQQDTIGYNIVTQLPKLIYNEIQNNNLKLWDSQKKNIEIKGSTLKDIEKSSGLSFSSIDNFFIYEIWTEEKNQVSGQLVGINFATRNKKDEDVTFGYVEYQDIKNLLQSKYLSININGFMNTTFDQALLMNRFNYSLVQYGDKSFSNFALSEKVKIDLFNTRKWAYEGPGFVKAKKVVYSIERDNVYGLLLSDSLEKYLNQNIEEFFNLGGR